MYETFDHTADLGLRIRASSINELFEESAKAVFATVVEDINAIQPLIEINLEIAGDDREYLLFDWLRELLYRFDAEHFLFSSFSVRIDASGLKAIARGEPFDEDRHLLAHEVKAITYHGLKVEESPEGWLAEIIVDI